MRLKLGERSKGARFDCHNEPLVNASFPDVLFANVVSRVVVIERYLDRHRAMPIS